MLETRNSYSDYYIEGYGKFEGLKLNVSNVQSIHNNSYGQDISDKENPKYGIIMLHKDNTVSFISLKSMIEGDLDVVKLDVENIVEVVSIDDMGYTTYLVDTDGNKTDVRDYIEAYHDICI